MTVETRVDEAIFGRACRLALARWILEHAEGRFFQSEPPKTVASPTAVRQELDRFVGVGLLRVERSKGDRRIYYVRTDSPLWEVFRTAVRLISEP